MKERETFASRLGFVLISAGCAIGLGNVWRFPYIVGQYGGAAFVLIYLFPVYLQFSTAFKTTDDFARNNFGLPSNWRYPISQRQASKMKAFQVTVTV